MRFSSMAVSVLAQSVPLLAVGHLAGWKKREERSWLQSRRLRDALLMGDHDKNGMLFEKRVGVLGKHDEVVKKKRSGSARLVQDRASSEVSSDNRKALVECDPLSKVTDSGIFDCGMDSHCVESEESEMGGLCVATNRAPSINRALQSNATCPSDEDGFTCDCSQFNNASGVGNFTCTGGYCGDPFCVTSYNYTVSYNSDGKYYFSVCYDDFSYRVDNSTVLELESFCQYFSYAVNVTLTECEIKANGVACNSCEPYTCPSGSTNLPGYLFNCTNNVLNVEGSSCDMDVLEAFVSPFLPPETGSPSASETGSPSASPDTMPTTAGEPTASPSSESGMPTTAGGPTASPSSESGMPTTLPVEDGEPTASPDKMPSPAPTSSGNSHAAKVTVVASAAAAAWVASFGA